MREYLNRLPDFARHTLPAALPTPQPSEEALEAEEWLRGASRAAGSPRPTLTAAPGDFTARVMARIEGPEPAAVVDVTMEPRHQPSVQTLRPLGIAGGVVGFAGLLVLTSLVAAFLLAPAALITLLNTFVGALVAILLLLTPLLDAAAALAANSALMIGLTALVAGFAILWPRTHGASTSLAREV